MVITNKSQTHAQTQDGVLCSIPISGMVIIKILRLFSNLEIGLYLAQELSSRCHIHNLFSFNYYFWNIYFYCSKQTSFYIRMKYCDVICTTTMAFHTYIDAPKQTLRFVSNHQLH